MRRPDLKLKRLGPKTGKKDAEREDVQEESYEFSRSREEAPFPNNNNVSAVPIQYREINIEPSTGISEGKLDKQRKRTYDLRNLLNL